MSTRLFSSGQFSSSATRWLPRLAAAAALVAAQQAAVAQAAPATGQATYRCVVLGDSAACPAPSAGSADWVEERVELGPLGRYFAFLGMDDEEAMAQAAERGEQAVRRTLRVSRATGSSAESHARYLAGGPTLRTEVELATAPVEATACAPVARAAGV